jgi:hypothetical protein
VTALTPLAARLLYAAALAERALRLASAERVAAEHEAAEVTRASRATIAWARGIEATVRAAARVDDVEWIDALGDLVAGMDAVDDDVAMRALGDFQRRLGSEPAFTDVAGFLRTCSADAPVVLGARRSPASRPGPTAAVQATLGTPCASPIGDTGQVVLAALVSDPHDRWVREHAGLHIAVDRRHRPHNHHAISLGDGSVVHFNGEPGKRMSDARIARDALSSVLEPDGVERAASLRPQRIDGVAPATLDPSVTCLRALSRLGEGGYELVRNNCEHFATSAQLGASVCFQTERYQGLVLPQTRAHKDVAWVLSRQLNLIGEPPPGDMLMDGVDDAYPIDLARAYWSRDREQIVIWFPLWSDTGEQIGGVDRPWTVGSLDAADWHAAAPALDLDPNWHASLVSVGGAQSYWLTSDGHWLHETRDVAAVVESRLQATRALLEALVAPPSAFAQRCVDVAESVVRGARRDR